PGPEVRAEVPQKRRGGAPKGERSRGSRARPLKLLREWRRTSRRPSALRPLELGAADPAPHRAGHFGREIGRRHPAARAARKRSGMSSTHSGETEMSKRKRPEIQSSPEHSARAAKRHAPRGEPSKHKAPSPDDDMPENIEEFRAELARRIRTFVGEWRKCPRT